MQTSTLRGKVDKHKKCGWEWSKWSFCHQVLGLNCLTPSYIREKGECSCCEYLKSLTWVGPAWVVALFTIRNPDRLRNPVTRWYNLGLGGPARTVKGDIWVGPNAHIETHEILKNAGCFWKVRCDRIFPCNTSGTGTFFPLLMSQGINTRLPEEPYGPL